MSSEVEKVIEEEIDDILPETFDHTIWDELLKKHVSAFGW